MTSAEAGTVEQIADAIITAWSKAVAPTSHTTIDGDDDQILARLIATALRAERDAAWLAGRDAAAKVADASSASCNRIWNRWSPGVDGNDRVIAHWKSRETEAEHTASAIRQLTPPKEG